MKGKIDQHGRLFVYRTNQWIPQLCPFASHLKSTLEYERDGPDKPMMCGVWCPLFGEPEVKEEWTVVYGPDRGASYPGRTEVQLCRTRLYFGTFTDEREGQDEH